MKLSTMNHKYEASLLILIFLIVVPTTETKIDSVDRDKQETIFVTDLICEFFKTDLRSSAVIFYDDLTEKIVHSDMIKNISKVWHSVIIVVLNEAMLKRGVLRRDTKIDLVLETFTNEHSYIQIWKNSVYLALSSSASYQDVIDYGRSVSYLKNNYDFLIILNENCESALLQEPLTDYLLKVCVDRRNSELGHFDVFRSCRFCEGAGKPQVYKTCDSNSINECTQIFSAELYDEKNFYGEHIRIVNIFPVENEDGLFQKFKRGEFVRYDNCAYCSLADILNYTFEVYEIEGSGMDMFQPQYENGTWTGVLGEVLYRKAEYTALIVPYVRTFQIISPTIMYSRNPLQVATHKPVNLINLLIILQPFDLLSWICTIFGVIAFSLTVWIFFRLEEIINHANSRAVKFLTFIHYTSRTLVGQPPDVPTSYSSVRVNILCWWLIALVLTTGYTSKLTALESVPPLSFIPRLHSEFIEANWNLLAPMEYYLVLKHVYKELMKLVTKGYQDAAEVGELLTYAISVLKPSQNLNSCLQLSFERDKTFCVAVEFHIFEFAQHFLDKHGDNLHEIIDMEFYTLLVFGGVRNGEPYSKLLNTIIQYYYMQGGFINKIFEWSALASRGKTLRKNKLKNEPYDKIKDDPNSPKPLTPKQILAPTILMAFGFAFAIISLFTEIMSNMFKKCIVSVIRKQKAKPSYYYLP